MVSHQRETQAGGRAALDPSPQVAGNVMEMKGKEQGVSFGLGLRQPGHGGEIDHHDGVLPTKLPLKGGTFFQCPIDSSQTARMTGEAGLENGS